MNKEEALAEIIDIQCGGGVARDTYPEAWRGSVAERIWDKEEFTLGIEYGYILALIDVFGITEDDLYNFEKENEE